MPYDDETQARVQGMYTWISWLKQGFDIVEHNLRNERYGPGEIKDISDRLEAAAMGWCGMSKRETYRCMMLAAAIESSVGLLQRLGMDRACENARLIFASTYPLYQLDSQLLQATIEAWPNETGNKPRQKLFYKLVTKAGIEPEPINETAAKTRAKSLFEAVSAALELTGNR